MRFIPTRIHGLLGYLVGALLIAAPYLFGFATGGAKQWVPMILGAGAVGYSLLTRYELGVMPVIPMPGHLWLDGLSGAFLAVSPWLFGFSGEVYAPHLLIGLFEIGAALMTQTAPGQADLARVGT